MKLTDYEITALAATLNYDDIESQLSDNYSNAGLKDLESILGWSKHQVAGLIGSLEKKGLATYDEEADLLWLTEKGIRAAFEKTTKAEEKPMKLNATEVKAVAKELKIKNWWNKKRADLITEICEIKGWSHEKPEVQEYLVAGGEIKTESPQRTPKRKAAREDQAEKNLERKKPRKTKGKVKAPKDKTGLVTLKSIMEELGVPGRVARRKLRGSEVQKPGAQWEWPEGHEDIAKVKELLGA